MRTWVPIGLCGFFLACAGCVCSPGGSCGNIALGPVAYRQAACNSCDSHCEAGSNGNFYSGPGPLSTFFGITNCAGGCGEIYVDEWLNEPPQVDQCGYSECLQCGRSPIRSMIQTILGRQYVGSCDSCDGGCCGAPGSGPIVQDGYETGAWSNNRACACGSQDPSSSSAIMHDHGSPGEVLAPSTNHDQSILNETIPSIPPSPAESAPNAVVPTPAPSLPPSSASRLNPAVRRVMR